MFNIQPGTGLGYTSSRELAFGLWFLVEEEEVPVVEEYRVYERFVPMREFSKTVKQKTRKRQG